MVDRDWLLSEGPAPIQAETKREKPPCTCGHPAAMHMGNARCARNIGIGPGSCWCDSYEPADICANAFPVVPLGKLEGE